MSEVPSAESDAGPFSVREIERALDAAGLQEGAEDEPYWDGRLEAVEIVRDMLGLTRVIPPGVGA